MDNHIRKVLLLLITIVVIVSGLVGCSRGGEMIIDTVELVRVNDGKTVTIPDDNKPSLFFYFTTAG